MVDEWTGYFGEVERPDVRVHAYLGYIYYEDSERIDYFNWNIGRERWLNNANGEEAPARQGQLLSSLVAHAEELDAPQVKGRWREDEMPEILEPTD